MIEPPTSLYDKACQLLFVRLGSNLPPGRTAEEDIERVEGLLEHCPVGGLVFFNSQWPEARVTLARAQSKSRFPLLVGADIERGIGQEVRGATLFPHAQAFGALEDQAETLVEEAAKVTAREGRACGIHIAFAPVADVNLTPENPIIGTRAFSSNPERVARLVRAYLRGCRAEGLLTTPKHFPGHGRTTTDPHAERPVVHASRKDLEETDFVPFRTAFENGADVVMTAHVAFPALDGDNTPATASERILKGLLREEMGFDGPVVSDSLIMGAVKNSPQGAGAQAAALVQAGVDLLLDPDDPEAVADGLVEAVNDGRLSEERIDEALGRLWHLKTGLVERYGQQNAFPTDPSAQDAAQHTRVGGPEHQRLSRRVARRAVTVLDNAPGGLPLTPERGQEMIFIRLVAGAPADDALLAKAVQEAFPQARYRTAGSDVKEHELNRLRQEAADADTVVLALRVEPAAWHAFGLTPSQQCFAEALVAEHPTVVAALGSPHVLDDFPQASARLCTFSDVPASQEALVEALTQS